MKSFNLHTNFHLRGDQVRAVDELTSKKDQPDLHQVLLGVTGSGKTFTIANVITRFHLPTLVMAPNKTLAAQLYGEFKDLFPENAVEYFVSYYDYYQPEAYVPATDTYIEKDSQINDEIDRMRHSATMALFQRNDVIIVASVSCIYGLGSAEAYYGMVCFVEKGQALDRDFLLQRLVELHYVRNDYAFERGMFRVRGDSVEVFPVSEAQRAVRIEFFGEEVERISAIDPLTGRILQEMPKTAIMPATHYITTRERMEHAVGTIRQELEQRLAELTARGRLLEAQRLEQRTRFDLEAMLETGIVRGIENYSRHLTGRKPGEPPPTLLDYFPDEYLMVIDESHLTVPQVIGMYRGDRARKQTLVDYGFRLPSALDNRPLKFDEFNQRQDRVIYVSATPSEYEVKRSENRIVEMIIRPTGLLDPQVEVRPIKGQVEDLYFEAKKRKEAGERVLVTTLTKKMAEHLTEYIEDLGVETRYLHSDIDTVQRTEILRDLRLGKFVCLVGINLLREGLDLPEVSLVAVLDADKQGFLRSAKSLIQVSGRASRNVNGKVIMYADRITPAMEEAISTARNRRAIQRAYNMEHGITPKTVTKTIHWLETGITATEELQKQGMDQEGISRFVHNPRAAGKEIGRLKKLMREAARKLEFEEAAGYRDRIIEIKTLLGIK